MCPRELVEANVNPLLDVLFGTYVCPDREPESFGIDTPSPTNYVGHMVEPLLPQAGKEQAQLQPTE